MTPKKGEWPERFLAKLKTSGNVTIAARYARISRTAAYALRAEDKAFAADWEDAMEQAADLLEEEARRRAYTGVLKPVTIAGEKEMVREYSDTLLIFLLKGAKPARYRENHKHEVSGPNGGPIPIREIVVERSGAAEEE